MAPAYTTIGTDPSLTWALGDVCRVEVTGASPTTLKVYKNGVLQDTETDSAGPQSGGAAGVGGFNDSETFGMFSWAGGRFPVVTIPAVVAHKGSRFIPAQIGRAHV